MPNLRNAMICIDCEELFSLLEKDAYHGTCPVCTSKSIYPLAKWLNKKDEAKKGLETQKIWESLVNLSAT